MVGRGSDLPASFQTVAARIARQLGVDRAVRVLSSIDVDVPVALGFLRPVVLLPAALALGLPTPAVEALLAHELAHVRRHDLVVNVVQSVVEALLFYHPAVWWVSSCLRAEREHCCDDAVVALTGDALGYARALVSLETTRTAALGVAANGGSLMARITRMVQDPPAPRARRVGITQTLAVAAALLAGATAPLVSCAAPADPVDPTGRAAAAASSLPPSVTRWTPSFVAAGQRHGVDPDLLAVVTLVESGGDPAATSPTGAVGLMQVMPATASHIAEERNLTGISAAQLREPDVNIDYGAYYLAALRREFGAGQDPARAVELTAAAYNGGEGAVRAYLADGTPLSDETMAYKDRVVTLWRQRQAAGHGGAVPAP
jgi:soluble lytic murein transglycosylase-like protein